MLGVVIFMQLSNKENVNGKNSETIWTSERIKSSAHLLVSKGLVEEAAAMYESYIRETNDSVRDVASICYRLGTLYMDISLYQKALSAFYRAEVLNPEGDFKSEMDQKIVEALENLGMTQQARYELNKRTHINSAPIEADPVVARIGKREITESEITREIDKLPEWMKKKYADEKGKIQFISEYVTREVLYQKARRLGFDTKKETREAVQNYQKQFVLQSFLEREVGSKIMITEADAELFYKGNKETYVEAQAVKVVYALISNDDAAAATELLKSNQGTVVDAWIEKGASDIPGIGEAPEAIGTLILKKKDEITDPLKIADNLYVFQIVETRAERQKSFEEVKEQIRFELGIKKEQELMSSLIGKTIEEQEVEILGLRK
jgi:peptidyl-prolyl cis-trans isomerase C